MKHFRTMGFVFGLLIAFATMNLSAQTLGRPGATLQLAPPYPEISPTFWESHHLAIIFGTIFLVLLMAALIWAWLRPSPPAVLPPETVAQEALMKLSGQPEDGACLSQVSQTLRQYFIAAFELPNREMTTTEFCAVMAGNQGIGMELGNQTADFLRQCDQRKFATLPVPTSTNTVARARQLVALGGERRRNLQVKTVPQS